MWGSLNDDIADLKSESESLDALEIGCTSMIAIETRQIMLISFRTIVTSRHPMNHIDDCLQHDT